MAGKGGPEGNQYARKQEGESERGITLTSYLDAYECAFLAEFLIQEGIEPTTSAIRKRARQMLKETLKTSFLSHRLKFLLLSGKQQLPDEDKHEREQCQHDHAQHDHGDL